MKNIKIDGKLLKVMGFAVGGLILLIMIIAMIASCSKPDKYTIEKIGELEAKLITVSQTYFKNNEEALPKEGSSYDLNIDDLIEAKLIKPLSEIVENGEECSAEITVSNNNGFYLYLPKVDCGNKYKYKSLFETLTAEEKIVTTGEGLYKVEGGYIYRGETLNNYLYFANKTWMILSINEDGTLKVMEVTKRPGDTVWDNRYNIDKSLNLGINDYITLDVNSRIKDSLLELYNNEAEFNASDKAHLMKQTLCIGKRAETDVVNDGSIECATTLENEMFGLLQVNEYINASLDPNCQSASSDACTNYNYLAKLTSSYWTITADKHTSWKAYKVSANLNVVNATQSASIKIVALLTSGLLFNEGDGSAENPYELISSPMAEDEKK